jgi:hypothetical protein
MIKALGTPLCATSLALALAATPARAAQKLDAVGTPTELAAYCTTLARTVGTYRQSEPRAFRHLVVADDYIAATIQTGFDSFNVISKRTQTGWSAPFVVGPGYPHVAALTAVGVPKETAVRLFARLMLVDDIPAADRIGACP